MKLYLGLALAAVMANAGVIDQAQKQFQENSGISQVNQDKLQTLAKQAIAKYGKMAQQEAKKVGIKFNFKQVMNKVQAQYEAPAKQAINKAANNAQAQIQSQINQAKNNPQVQKLQNRAQTATFNSVISNIQNQLKKQLQKVPNNKAKKNLIRNRGAPPQPKTRNADAAEHTSFKK